MMETNLNLTRISSVSRAHESNYGSIFTPIQVPGEKVIEMFKKGHKIHIKKANRGKFTESAKRAGMGVQEYASHVLANKDKYSSTLVKRANFARNASKWKK